MKDFIKYFDFLSMKPNMKINKEERLKSFPFGFMSLLAYLIVVGLGIYFVNQLLSRSESTITSNDIPDMSQKINLSDLPYTIALRSNLGTPLSDDIYSLKSEIWKFSLIKNSKGEEELGLERIVVKHEKCDINKHFGKYSYLFNNLPYLSSSYCPIPGINNITLKSVYGANDMIFLQHYFSRCLNDTKQNRTNCSQKELVEERLESAFITYNFLEYSIDHKNISSPGSLLMRQEVIPASSTIYSRTWYYISNILYTTDMGYIFEDLQSVKYFQVSRYIQTYSLLNSGTVSGSFAVVTMSMYNKSYSFKRSYMKFQNFLANIGGVVKGVVLVIQIISYHFCLENYNFYLISSLFNIGKDINPSQPREIKNSEIVINSQIHIFKK
jgi:hypothetical protein